MTTTTGMPERSRWSTDDLRNAFAADAVAARGYLHFADEADPEPEPDYYNASADPNYVPPGSRRSPRSQATAMAAIADAMGVDVEELDGITLDDMDGVFSELTDHPQDAFAALDEALSRRDFEKANPGQSDGAYKVRAGNWRERNGLPRTPKHLPPSRTPEARRRRHLQTLVDAGTYPDLATAERLVARKGGNKRPTAARPESPHEPNLPQLR